MNEGEYAELSWGVCAEGSFGLREGEAGEREEFCWMGEEGRREWSAKHTLTGEPKECVWLLSLVR